MTYPVAATVLHTRKPATRSASVRFEDDYEVQITRPGRKIKTRTGGTTETNTFCLLDVTESSEKRLRKLLESPSFETHEYDDWSDRGYEVAVIEHCYKCQPVHNDEPVTRPVYICWWDKPSHYRCEGY